MLVNALYYNRGIQVINLTQNLMTEKVVDAFVELLRAKKTIKTIYLNQNCLSTRNLKQKVKEMASLGVNLCV